MCYERVVYDFCYICQNSCKLICGDEWTAIAFHFCFGWLVFKCLIRRRHELPRAIWPSRVGNLNSSRGGGKVNSNEEGKDEKKVRKADQRWWALSHFEHYSFFPQGLSRWVAFLLDIWALILISRCLLVVLCVCLRQEKIVTCYFYPIEVHCNSRKHFASQHVKYPLRRRVINAAARVTTMKIVKSFGSLQLWYYFCITTITNFQCRNYFITFANLS